MTDEQWEAELVAAHLDAAEQEKRRRAAEAEVERLRAALRDVEAAAGEYMAENGIRGYSGVNYDAENVLVGVKDIAESALLAAQPAATGTAEGEGSAQE